MQVAIFAYLYDSYKNGTADYKGYFSAEYKMLNTLREYEKPISLCLMAMY
ncbi:enoyl-CoA hydratase/isomerase family protein [Klebsiella pneumoniae subsp. pneumoniae MP14]|nr:enoyl-CoA hydratase/isomerase family protein [Klebsiella pneumoniae subsp. pneumoniae MP14]